MRSLLAYRPVSVLHRLPRGSAACPLSSRHLLAASGLPPRPLAVVVAPLPAVARGALAAAREARAAIGLHVPPAVALGAWLDAVARAADEVAPGLPFFVSAEVALASADDAAIERAGLLAARLVEAGATHLRVDGAALPAGAARALADVAAVAADREIGIELALPPAEVAAPAGARERVAAFEAAGVAVDLVAATLPAPADAAEARGQARTLALLARGAGAPVARRGAASLELLRLLAGSPVRACDDGGAAAAAGLRALAVRDRAALGAGERVALSADVEERVEALAWSEASRFLDALGAAGSAASIAARFVAGDGR